MIQRVKNSHDDVINTIDAIKPGGFICSCFWSLIVQTKKVEREAVSSSDSEDNAEEKKITLSYKSTRSAVRSLHFSLLF